MSLKFIQKTTPFMLNFPSIFSIYVHTSLVRSLLLWFYEQRSCIHFHFPFHTDNAKYVILRQIEKKVKIYCIP